MAISSSLVSFGTFVGIFALLALGMNIKFGYTGLLEIGHVAFYLLGGYITALLVLPPASQSPGQVYILGLNMPWLPAILIATVAAGVAGALISLPAIRLREDYLAITLLGIAFVIQQIFRSPNFHWLANGPRALTIQQLPMSDLFPLPGAGVANAVLFGIIVFFFWTVTTYLIATVGDVAAGPEDIYRQAVHGLLAATSLGVGYVLARYAAGDGKPDVRIAALSGLVVGGFSAVAVAAGLPSILPLAVVGAFSLFTWAFGLLALGRYYRDLSAVDALYGLGITVALFVALVPLVVLGSGRNEGLAAAGLIATTALVAAFVYGLYYLSRNWGRYGTGTGLVRIVGVAAVWLFMLRYFVLPLINPVLAGGEGVGFVADQTFQNLVWLLEFDPDQGVFFDYARFLFVGVVGAVAVVYYLSEVTAKSPFGRVLKAIREDEDVATALGKNTFAYKVQGMAIGSAFAGLAGALTAIQFQSLTWQLFRVEITFFVLLMVIIGGTANNRGVILGSAIFWAFDRATTDLATFFPTAAGSSIRALRLVIIGALLIVILYYRPEGVWGEEPMGVSTE